MKPIDSSGSNGFHKCIDELGIELAYTNLFTIPNVFGLMNENCIVME